jgi:hypothetical protein
MRDLETISTAFDAADTSQLQRQKSRMNKTTLAFLLVVLSSRAFCWSKQMDFNCGELAPGASQSYLENFRVGNKYVAEIRVNIQARNVGTAHTPKCHITWAVSGTSRGRSQSLFRYATDTGALISGVAFDGTSPDGTKVLLDFFSTAGDRTDHRPGVYDFLSLGYQIREVADKLTRNLPNCKYSTMLNGVTNRGEVILDVPKSMHADVGCPDQGEWLMNMRNGAITRFPAHATHETQSAR